MRRRLAFDRSVQGQQDFRHRRRRPFDQAADLEPIGADAVEWRQVATQDMVEAADDARALERPQVADLLHHHDQARVAARVLANCAGRNGVEIAAIAALDDLGRGIAERRRQGLQQLRATLEQRQSRLARRARP